MSLTDELLKLEKLYQNGSLSAAEFAQAKAAIFNVANPQTSEIETLTKEAKLLRLDRSWQMAQESYMVSGRYGVRRLPTVGVAWTSILLVGGFGVFWTIMAFNITSVFPSFGGGFDLVRLFPIFGVAFTVFGVWSGFDELTKAQAYQTAESEYHRQRRELENSL